MYNPHKITKKFEKALCKYTGARYAVAVNSCTMALLLALEWEKKHDVNCRIRIPKYTYVSVPQAALKAGYTDIQFPDLKWKGEYRMFPTFVFDSARRFTQGMYLPGRYQCVSFHSSKILGDSQGGAILHDNPDADAWFRKARFDGRTEGVAPKDDKDIIIGHHCYMSPDVAARLLWKLQSLPLHNPDLPNDDYPDLSQLEVFK